MGACGLRLVWVATVFRMYPSPWILYLSYPVTWTITGIVQLLFFLYVRKRAYARVQGGDALVSMEGRHPPVKAGKT